MRLFYKGLALAATLAAAAAFAKPNFQHEVTGNSQESIGSSSAFDSPFATGPKTAFESVQPMAKPLKQSIGVQVTPVPEPGEWALMGAGLALVAYLARRNRRKK